MDDSTKDKAEGAAHDLKGTVKEKAGPMPSATQTLKTRALLKSLPGKSRKRSATSKKFLKNSRSAVNVRREIAALFPVFLLSPRAKQQIR